MKFRAHFISSTTLIAIALLLVSCRGDKQTDPEYRPAKGNVFNGGVFKMNEVETFRNLFPLSITENVSVHISAQVYEGLVKFNQKDLSIGAGIAQKWEVSADAQTWTFHLRKGIRFHDDPCFADGKGRVVTARDFKYCFDKLCEAGPMNQLFPLTFKDRVVGADEYYASTVKKDPLAGGVSGVHVVDDYTLKIELKNPFSAFLKVLATPGCWVYPKEAWEKYGNEMRIKCVGTGPFVMKNVKEGELVVLERNENYWDMDEFGNQLPYLDRIQVSFIKEKKSELLEFKRGNLDMIFGIPIENIPEILDQFETAKEGKNVTFDLQVVPAMTLFYYGFQHTGNIFNKKQVRQAFNYAVDREKIVTYTLQGAAIPANYGVIPPCYTEYDAKKITGYKFDPEKAKKLLAEAGYPGGKGFPRLTLQTNSGGEDRNIQLAEVIQKMLKDNLGIDVDINVLPMAEHLDAIETGKTEFWRTSWIADYPDPGFSLVILYGSMIPEDESEHSYINSVRYKNAAFDSLYRTAQNEVDETKRMELYRRADQLAMDDAAVLPIFYDENYRLVHLNVRNCEGNAMDYRDFVRTYKVPKVEKK